MSTGWETVASMTRALPYMNDDQLELEIRELVEGGFWRSIAIKVLIGKALGFMAQRNPGLLWLGLRAAADGRPDIREAAHWGLKQAGIPQETIESHQEALGLELDADLAIEHGAIDQALSRYRTLIERFPANADSARFRFARELQESGKTAEARSVLEPLLSGKASPANAALAARRIEFLQHPTRVYDAKLFAATLVKFDPPELLRQHRVFKASVEIKNSSTIAWQGGFWRAAMEVNLEWQKADGTIVQPRVSGKALLPPQGVLPGEVVTVDLIGGAPDEPGQTLTLHVCMKQPWVEFPNRGRIGSRSVRIEDQ